MSDIKAPQSKWTRRIRSVLLHVVLPAVALLGWMLLSAVYYWDDFWLHDLLPILLIMGWNLWAIWTAEWNRKLSWWWRVLISIAAVLFSLTVLGWFSLQIRIAYS